MNQIQVNNFSLEHTLDSGQFFLYEPKDNGSYKIINGENTFVVKQKDNQLLFEGINEEDLIYFFGLDEDFEEKIKTFDDEYLQEALELYYGMRLIKGDLWQTIIGFVCSSAANIPKIKMNLRLLTEFFGEEGFPKPGSMTNYDKIIAAKTGYRAKFIFAINQIINDNPDLLNKIRDANYEEAKQMLTQLPGIGVKVADCICLYALGHEDAFPIDTWIKQTIEKLYLKREAKNLKEIEQFINNYFKQNRGLKQQYLFHYMRNRKD